VGMSPVSAHDVAWQLRLLLPGVAVKKLHTLLYYCQGHHLAHFEQPLFVEPVMAWDMGPVVANLWKVEKDDLPLPEPIPLDNGQLNTVAYVVSRYGRLTRHDLELLTHAEAPWLGADQGRPPSSSSRIEPESIRSFFASEGGPDADLPWPSSEDVSRLAAGARDRRAAPAANDDLAELHARLVLR
jgi:uncharacterized phage-associated protein